LRVRFEAPTLSETFRRLVGEIETTNGIVYVEAGKCRFGVRACLIHSIDVPGPVASCASSSTRTATATA